MPWPKLGAEAHKVVAPHEGERLEEGRAEGGDVWVEDVEGVVHGSPGVCEDGEGVPSVEVGYE